MYVLCFLFFDKIVDQICIGINFQQHMMPQIIQHVSTITESTEHDDYNNNNFVKWQNCNRHQIQNNFINEQQDLKYYLLNLSTIQSDSISNANKARKPYKILQSTKRWNCPSIEYMICQQCKTYIKNEEEEEKILLIMHGHISFGTSYPLQVFTNFMKIILYGN